MGIASIQSLLVERSSSDIIERVRLPIDAFQSPDRQMADLLEYWHSLRTDGLLPPKKLLDPIELRKFVGRLHIIDTSSPDPEDYFFSLYGSEVSLDRGKNYGKVYLRDFPHPAYRRTILQDYADVVATGCPAYHLILAQIDYINYQYARLILPFAVDGRSVSHLLIFINERQIADAAISSQAASAARR